jgi:hypothetical protein
MPRDYELLNVHVGIYKATYELITIIIQIRAPSQEVRTSLS